MADKVQDLIAALPDDKIDMITATSVLQQQASEIRSQKINWMPYKQSQMISAEDYDCIVQLEENRSKYIDQQPDQCAKTFLNLLGHVSKDQTIQYLLVMIDDILQDNRARVDVFIHYGQKKKESVWSPFLNLLNRQDGFIVNMSSSILAKMACCGSEQMSKADLNFYLQWLKDQLTNNVAAYLREMDEANSRRTPLQHHQHHQHHHHHNPLASHHNQQQPQTASAVAAQQGTYKEVSSAIDEPAYLAIPTNEYIQSVARCLQMMLRVDEYRFAFVNVDGISTIINILQSRVNFQVQYQLIFCLWVLTFNPLLAEKMNKFQIISILADILSDSAKEKVTRIILAVFRNLIEKPDKQQVAKEHCIAMVQCKVLKQLSIFEQRRFDDEDIAADVEFLSERLQSSVQDLSSFDEYATEVRSGRLEWSPVHKSAKFWRENAQRLNEKNNELLRTLVHLLETVKDPLVLSVASYDIGEYVRHYPRGKTTIENLGGKQLVMQLLAHEDPNVRYEALLAVQKLMVHNWEYLGKQLEKDKEGAASAGGAPISNKA